MMASSSILSASAFASNPASRLNPNASAFASNTVLNPLKRTLERLKQCKFSEKDTKQLSIPLGEWYSSSTLDKVLTCWEKYGDQTKILDKRQQVPLTFVSYNVQGWATRGLEVLDLIYTK
jgi:dissimilatory sulfite reductase (desulfoviridin) alpha/beta subunit